MERTKVFLLSLALCVSSAVALLSDDPNHNILHNGDFEYPGLQGPDPTVGGIRERAHPSRPNAWFVTLGSIKYVRNDHWRAARGRHSVALNDDGAGAISQTVRTQPGESYFVYFNLAGDPGLEHGAHRGMNVSVMAEDELLAIKPFLVDTYRHMKFDKKMQWEEHFLAFTATDNRATITFASTTPGVHGPIVDNVRVFKRDAVSGFYKAANTAFGGPPLLALGPNMTAEGCARRCLEVPGCHGFALQITVGRPSGPCQLKGDMRLPVGVPEFNMDSYILKEAPCSFGHHTPKPCSHVLPGHGLAPLVCVSRGGWKRTQHHPYHGICKPLEQEEMCHMFGGYFPAGSPAIGSGDHLRRCSCTRSLGMASLQCTKAI